MKKLIPFFILIFIITACNKSIDSEEYKGKTLSIGVIGLAPEVQEKEIIDFDEIKFSDIENKNIISKYDAVIITEENLSEASKPIYKAIYKKSKIPFFFIKSKKSYIPFTEDDISYDDALDFNNGEYATGILYSDKKLKWWTYGLYNDVENRDNIEDVYTRIFQTISDN
ncbi:transcription elongation factor GreAB [Anaeromicropila herbilytica]|uniref:Lipoprotein n=1 Tax=Anaeromicropila herbilytica TaxID=2785025 RepID=A0A7R7IDI5_9FIRM|nr:transcription elongation factor GreAB [Anaeromicropila herbilytica]BCN30996.1 hypothetical protein bsdtb5_22910 [Anaeromicropila herbilytica]